MGLSPCWKTLRSTSSALDWQTWWPLPRPSQQWALNVIGCSWILNWWSCFYLFYSKDFLLKKSPLCLGLKFWPLCYDWFSTIRPTLCCTDVNVLFMFLSQDSEKYVEQLLTLFNRFSKLVKEAFQDDPRFLTARDKVSVSPHLYSFSLSYSWSQ